jgi:RNA polymerase sigma-70 factor, ECF subfamily
VSDTSLPDPRIDQEKLEEYRGIYEELLGFVPPRIQARTELLGRLDPEFLSLQEEIRKRGMYPDVFDVIFGKEGFDVDALRTRAAGLRAAIAEDLPKVRRALDTLQDLQSFEKWVFRILVNTFISDRRRRQARPVEELPGCDGDGDRFSLFEQVHQPFLLWWGNPEQQLLDKLLREDIVQALETLPEGFRLVVVMIEVWGFSYAETAEILDVPVGTVRSRLSRGRALLQRALWRQASGLGIAVDGPRGEAG